jgi:hypothetical protein
MYVEFKDCTSMPDFSLLKNAIRIFAFVLTVLNLLVRISK